MHQTIPGIFGGKNKGPLVLLFSPRERLRDILSVGLVQCGFQIIQAETSYLATIKANQMLPKAVIIDISADNSKDILLAERLKKSIRSRGIAVLLITPKQVNEVLIKSIADLVPKANDTCSGPIQTINFPFAFSDFLERLKRIVTQEDSDQNTVLGRNKQNRIIEERIFDITVEPSKKMFEIGSVLQNHWAFPFTIIKAMDILESDSGCCYELAKCISTDAAVSSAVLKIANTVQFARRHGRITDIKEAVVRLGFRETRNIMACLSLINLSPDIYKSRGFERREFWLHSLAVALIAEKLCSDAGFRRPELAFIAGLLHDLGKIPLDNNFDLVFPRLLDQTMATCSPFYEIETSTMGFNHAELGHYLTTQWNFPSVISCAILYHHNHQQILKTTIPFDKIIQESVYLANQLAKAVNIGHTCDEILEEIPSEIMRDLKMENGPSDHFFRSVQSQLQLLCSYLNLDTESLAIPMQRQQPADSDIVIVYNEKIFYHPMVTALRNNGFHVLVTNQLKQHPQKGKRVIISMPERGLPLDIMFYGDDKQTDQTHSLLKIFIVDTEQPRSERNDIPNDDILFIDRSNFDIRLLIHTLDNFFEKIITAAEEEEETDVVPPVQ